MTVYHSLPVLDSSSAAVALTLGMFDGVHRGHQAILARLREAAAALHGNALVLTYAQHPAQVVRPESSPLLICTLEERLRLFEQAGVAATVILPFDDAFSKMNAAAFIQTVLLDTLRAQAIVVGHDCRFGHQREGGAALLQSWAARAGFAFFDVPALRIHGDPVSSTAVRQAIQDGDLEKAALLLGRPWTISAGVLPGHHIGRTLGFPTANLDTSGIVLPAAGVYACRVALADTWYNGTMYVGTKPTFPGHTAEVRCEVYLIGFSGDLYDRRLTVRPLQRLRNDQRFATPEALRQQITLDVAAARQLLEKRHAAD